MKKKPAAPHEGRHSFWIKYAVTYLLVMLVPFCAFSVFFNLYLNGQTRLEAQTAMENTVEKIQADFDQKVAQMFAISAQVGQVRDFKAAAFSQYSYETRSAIQRTLLSYAGTSLFFDDILYYHQALPQVVFSTMGTYVASFYRTFFNSAADRWETLDQMTADGFVQRWIPPSQALSGRIPMGNALLYCQPLQDAAGGCLFFEMRESSIAKLLSPVVPGSEIFIFLGDQALYPFGAGSLPEGIAPGAPAARRADGRYQYALTSAASGLTYVYICEASGLGNVAKTALTAFMALTAAASLLCFALVVLTSRRHAEPIDQLVTLTEGIVPGDVRGLARVQTAMQKLQSRSQELDEMRQDAMRGHALIRLIRGKYQTEQDAEENLRRLDITFRQPCRVIMLLQRDAEGEDRNLAREMTALLSQKHDVYGFAYAESGVYVLMVGMESPDRQGLFEELSALAARPEFEGTRPRFSVGGSFTAFTSARESYMQALSAGRRDADAAVALFRESDADELFYPREELRALGAALENQDRNRASFLYDVLLSLVRRHNHIYFYTVSLLSAMINLYLQALPPEKPGPADAGNRYGASLQGEYMGDAEDMMACLQRLHARALREMTENDLSGSDTEMTGIANYISACEDLETLSVSAVADRFGINASSLSHKFKEQMGCNISDYILTCKMNHACSLLRATDETVADIANRVGYSQYTSFVRTFKRLQGMTPTAYRDAFRRGGAGE